MASTRAPRTCPPPPIFRPALDVDQVRAADPERFARVRSACVWAAEGVDLDEHAAAVVNMIGVRGHAVQ